MISAVLFATGLFVVGLLIGRRAVRSDRSRGPRVVRWIVAIVVGVPTTLIVLAKLFQSDVLGWFFGFSLIALVALVPCTAVFGVGWLFGRWSRASSARRAAIAPPLTVHVTRDGVHASDDEGLDSIVAVAPSTTLGGLLAQVLASGWLPTLSSGDATWTIETSARPGTPIGVCAQQWSKARLVVVDRALASHFAHVEPSIRFRYRCQVDPDRVLDDVSRDAASMHAAGARASASRSRQPPRSALEGRT